MKSLLPDLNNRGRRLLLTVGVIASLVVPSTAAATSPTEPEALASGLGQEMAFLPGGPNSAFDEQTLRMIASHAEMVTIRTGLNPEQAGDPSYQEVVSRLKQLNPELKVLIYAHAVSYPHTSGFENDILRPIYETHPEWILGSIQGGRVDIGDARNRDFRLAVIDNTKAAIDQVGADGVMFDNAKLSPKQLLLSLSLDPLFVDDWKSGMRTFFREAERRIGPKLMYFNGVKQQPYIQLNEQQQLWELTDGAVVENFGGYRQEYSFAEGIELYLNFARRYPDKPLNFFGKTSDYQDYHTDYRRQRYYYSSYLMVRSDTSTFQYNGTYSINNLLINESTGLGDYHPRSFGTGVYADQEIALGSPVEPFHIIDGVYVRRFSQGIVLMVPAGQSPKQYELDQAYYNLAGDTFEGTVGIAGGQGMILTSFPQLRPAFRIDSTSPGLRRSPGVTVQNGGQFDFFRFGDTTEPFQKDIRLDDIREPNPGKLITLKVRTQDPSARLRLVAEVDDTEQELNRIAIDVPVAGAAPDPDSGMYVHYRADSTGDITMPYFQIDADWTTDSFKAITIDPGDLDTGGRFTFRRWDMMRPLGDLDLAEISIAPPER